VPERIAGAINHPAGEREMPTPRRPALSALPRDALAGVLLAAIAIPAQLATARLAGMPPEAGLFTFAAGAFGFALVGTNRFLVSGADSTIAPIFAGGLAAMATFGSPDYAALAGLLSLIVGGLLLGAAVLRASWVADLLSIPVTTGFMAGVAVHIIVGQVPSVLGVPDTQGNLAERFLQILHGLPDTNPYALAIGVFVLIVTQVSQRWAKHVPGALLALAAVAVATAALHLRQHGVEVLDALPRALPHIAIPVVKLSDIPRVALLALIVALVCMMQTSTVLRTYPSHRDGPRHMARDFGGIGAGCVLASLIGGFAVNASPPSTAVVVSAGGTSKAVSVTAAILAMGLLAGGGGMLAYVPQAALGAILIAVALRIFRVDEMVNIARRGGSEIWLVAASTALVVGLPIQTGMLASIVLSLLHSFYTVARPLCLELARAPGTTVWWPPQGEAGEHEPGLLVFAPAAPLNFTNAAFIRGRLALAMDQARTPIRMVVIEASGVTDIDYTGATMVRQLVETLREKGIQVALARLSAERAYEQAVRTGMLEAFGPKRVFRSVEDAVRSFKASSG
jgi:MFS superfamily sulfate permease-like transporter